MIIEKLTPRDALRPYDLITGLRRGRCGSIVEGTLVTVQGFNLKHAIKRFRDMTDGADFIVAPKAA